METNHNPDVGGALWASPGIKITASSGVVSPIHVIPDQEYVIFNDNEATVATLKLWGESAFAEEEAFIERFCPGAWILTNVSWSSENMCVVYILESGQHVSGSFKIEEWFEFLKTIENK